jgi:hypothetical protein
MSKIDKGILKEFAKNILFENEINEMFQPDDDMHAGKNMRYSMYDRPGPDLDIKSNIEDMPVSPEHIVSNQLHHVRKEINKLTSDNYFPTTNAELAQSLKDAFEQVEMTHKEIEDFWLKIKKYLSNKNN